MKYSEQPQTTPILRPEELQMFLIRQGLAAGVMLVGRRFRNVSMNEEYSKPRNPSGVGERIKKVHQEAHFQPILCRAGILRRQC